MAVETENQNSEQATTQQPAATEQPGGARNSVRDDVIAAFKENETKAAETTKTAETAKAAEGEKASAESGEQKRGADGQFVKTAAEKTAETAKPGEQKQPDALQAPAGWNGGGKVVWARLPRDVQENIITDYKARADLESRFNPLSEILGPREQALAAQYGSTAAALRQLFALSDYASRDPHGFAQWFLAQRGINPSQLSPQTGPQPGRQIAGQQSQQIAPEQITDPVLRQVVAELNGLKGTISQAQLQAHQQAQAEDAQLRNQATAEVHALSANSEKYPYFNDVRSDMAVLFQNGTVKTLDEAYTKAVHMNDSVRERVLSDRVNAELEKRVAAAAEKKNAAVSVTGAPGGQLVAGNTRGARPATVRDDVMAAANAIGFFGTSRL